MVICHLRNVNIEGLLEEYLVLLIVDVLEKTVGIPMLVCQQIIYVAVDLHHRHRGIVNVLYLAYPLVLKLLLQLSVDLREHGLRVVLLSLALARRCDNHEVDVRPGQAELGGM